MNGFRLIHLFTLWVNFWLLLPGFPCPCFLIEPIEVARSFRERIARDNAADCDLYDHAVALHAQRGRRRSA